MFMIYLLISNLSFDGLTSLLIQTDGTMQSTEIDLQNRPETYSFTVSEPGLWTCEVGHPVTYLDATTEVYELG